MTKNKEQDLAKARELERLSRKHEKLSRLGADAAKKLRRKHVAKK